MGKFVNQMVDRMIKDGTIEEEDSEIYEFGLRQGIIMIINYVLTLLIGIVMHMVIETIIFMAVYIPVRSYAGGVHAKTQARCFFWSNFLVIGMLLGIRYCIHSPIVLCAMLIYAIIAITILAPVEDKNKPLDEMEVKIYGKKARILLSINTIVGLVFIIIEWWMPAICICLTLGLMGTVLILGRFKNYLIDRKEKEYT